MRLIDFLPVILGTIFGIKGAQAVFEDFDQVGYNCDVINVLGSYPMESLEQRLPGCQEKVLNPQKVLSCAREEGKRLMYSMLLQKFGYVALHHENRSMDGHFFLRDRSTFFHVQCGKMTFKFLAPGPAKCTNFEQVLLSNGSKAFYDPIEHIITPLSTPVPCQGKHRRFGEIFHQDIMQQLTGKIISLAALKKIPPSLSLNHIFNKEAIKSLIHEEELQLEDGNPNMAAWNEFWRKWSPQLDMFTLGVLVTFLVGVFAAARYSRLSPLRTMALMNGFAKTFYDYLKFKKEQKAEGQDP